MRFCPLGCNRRCYAGRNVAKDLIPQLKEKGKVSRGWLGVAIDKLTPELREHVKLGKKVNVGNPNTEKEKPFVLKPIKKK